MCSGTSDGGEGKTLGVSAAGGGFSQLTGEGIEEMRDEAKKPLPLKQRRRAARASENKV